MFNEIVFVDFENFTEIIDDIKKINAKIVVLVGLHQAKRSFDFADKLLDSVYSVELLKVKANGEKDALDFFIAYYLGVYTNSNKKLKFTICSNDKGYDPLINHLRGNGINIKRLEFRNEPKVKAIQKPQEQSNLFEADKDYKNAFNSINKMRGNKPRTLKRFESNLKSLYKTIEPEKINKIIDEFKNHKYIEVDENGKMIYNM